MLNDQYVLAAYVDGFDLDDVAPKLRDAFREFAASGSWPAERVMLVDQRQPPDPSAPGDFPPRDLGLNLGLDHLPQTPGWFTEIEALVGLLKHLNAETGREFVFLCFQSEPWRQEHLAFVGAGDVDIAWIRGAIQQLTGLSKV